MIPGGYSTFGSNRVVVLVSNCDLTANHVTEALDSNRHPFYQQNVICLTANDVLSVCLPVAPPRDTLLLDELIRDLRHATKKIPVRFRPPPMSVPEPARLASPGPQARACRSPRQPPRRLAPRHLAGRRRPAPPSRRACRRSRVRRSA